MPKVKASMADVSTEYVLIDPGTYRLRIKSIEEEAKKSKAPKSGQEVERTTYIVKSVVVSDADGGTDHANKPIFDWINIHTKEGELNDISLANLKRYFEAIAPDSADSEDADTDELINGEFMADVYIDEYEKAGGQTGQSNKLKSTTISPLQ